jgi:hypothetical protein
MMHRHGWAGPRATSSIPFAWFCWDRNHVGPAIVDRVSAASPLGIALNIPAADGAEP